MVAANGADGWATCPLTEGGFVRVSSNPAVLPSAIRRRRGPPGAAIAPRLGEPPILADDVSMIGDDVPSFVAHRNVSAARLLTLARQYGVRLVTFEGGVRALGGADVELLRALSGPAAFLVATNPKLVERLSPRARRPPASRFISPPDGGPAAEGPRARGALRRSTLGRAA